MGSAKSPKDSASWHRLPFVLSVLSPPLGRPPMRTGLVFAKHLRGGGAGRSGPVWGNKSTLGSSNLDITLTLTLTSLAAPLSRLPVRAEILTATTVCCKTNSPLRRGGLVGTDRPHGLCGHLSQRRQCCWVRFPIRRCNGDGPVSGAYDSLRLRHTAAAANQPRWRQASVL